MASFCDCLVPRRHRRGSWRQDLLVACLAALAGCAARAPRSEAPVPTVGGEDAVLARLLVELGSGGEARKQAAKLLALRGESVVPRLLTLLRSDPRWTFRWDVVEALGEIGDRRAIAGVVECIVGDDSLHVRWRALYNLARLDPGGVEARPLFAAELPLPDSGRRWNAAVGLSFFSDLRALPWVHEGLSSPDSWVRFEAISALERVHDERSSTLLEPLFFSQSDPRHRNAVVMSLGALCDTRAKALLARALGDADAGLRWRAASGLGRCGDRTYAKALAEQRLVETDALALSTIDRVLARWN